MATSTKPLFKTAYGKHERISTPTGDRYDLEYGYEVNKAGSKVLVVTGKTDRYAKIQEQLEETKIENILKQAAIGDMSNFRPDGIYMDCTEAPKDLLEARQMIQKMENLWLELPKELRDKYDNDIGKFIAEAGSEEWLRNMGYTSEEKQNPSEAAAEEKEVPANE